MPCLALCQVLGLYAAGSLQAQQPQPTLSPAATDSGHPANGESGNSDWSEAADSLLASIRSASLHDLIAEVLDRNPEIARAKRLAVAAEMKAPQVRALPDPVAAW